MQSPFRVGQYSEGLSSQQWGKYAALSFSERQKHHFTWKPRVKAGSVKPSNCETSKAVQVVSDTDAGSTQSFWSLALAPWGASAPLGRNLLFHRPFRSCLWFGGRDSKPSPHDEDWIPSLWTSSPWRDHRLFFQIFLAFKSLRFEPLSVFWDQDCIHAGWQTFTDPLGFALCCDSHRCPVKPDVCSLFTSPT